MRRRRKKRIGISLLLLAAAFTLPALGEKKKSAPSRMSCWPARFSGNRLRAAECGSGCDSRSAAGHAAIKIKKVQTVSDSRGEFAFRLPPPAHALHHQSERQGLPERRETRHSRGPEDRLDVTFQLHEESK